MREDKSEAIRLRKLGKSYSEVKAALGVPKSTLSDWLRNIEWSRKIKNTLAIKARAKNTVRLRELNGIYRAHLAKLYQEARAEARREFHYFKLHPLFIVGMALYWGEGDRSSRHLVRLANTDPAMIKIFVQFLYKICGAPKEKVRAYILLYPDLDPETCVRFWIRTTGLSRENLTKPVVIQGKHKTRRLQYGVCTVGATSTYLKEKILVWLELLPKELIRERYYSRE